jgi:hypothetical protein
MHSARWLAYFRANALRPVSPQPAPIALERELHEALVHSLQRFHLGENGEGRVAREAAEVGDPVLDEALVRCVDLYVKEEGRHARELVAALKALGARPLRRALADDLFRWGRRTLGLGRETVAGLRAKMLVIAAAEVVGIVYYRILAERVPARAIRAMAHEIAEDEAAHLDFQAAYTRAYLRAETPRRRPWLAAGASAFFGAALLSAIGTVAIGQRRLLRALRIDPIHFAGRCVAEVRARLPLDDAPPGVAVLRPAPMLAAA